MYHLINTFKALYVFNVGQVHKPPLLYYYKQPFYNNVSDVGLVGVDFFFSVDIALEIHPEDWRN